MNELNPACVESVIRKAKEGKLTTGQAEIHTGPEPSVEKIRFKIEERLETNNPIMTLFTLFIFFYTPLHLFTLLISFYAFLDVSLSDRPLLCREKPMARGIPLVIIGGNWMNPYEGKRASLLGFQEAEARAHRWNWNK